ncbi:MAG: hypothetical protein Q8L47_01755 [bacterium]|nr:hypothetical protein [bacterium]
MEDDLALQEINKGVVILWKDFEFFITGERKDSRFLILSNCHPQFKSFLAIRATTKTESYEKSINIVREFIIIPPNSEKPLPAKSAIDLGRIEMLDWAKIKPHWGSEVKIIGSISEELINRFDKLVNTSRTIRRDWKAWVLNSKRI